MVSKSLWETAMNPSFAENPGIVQSVQFYADEIILTKLQGAGYEGIYEYYSNRDKFSVVWTGSVSKLVRGTAGVTFDIDTMSILALTTSGTFDGGLSIIGASGGELSQALVDAAVIALTLVQNGARVLHTLTIGANFTTLRNTLSLKGTGIKNLCFPAESPLTTTGFFRLVIDSASDDPVVLPLWVTETGPWSL
jgi:hypothetical protein